MLDKKQSKLHSWQKIGVVCLFLTESLCKQQLLIISEQALPSRLSGSHQQAVKDGCEQRGRKTTLPGSVIFHVEVMV